MNKKRSGEHVQSNSIFPFIKISSRTTTPTGMPSASKTDDISFAENIPFGDKSRKPVLEGNKTERRISFEDSPSIPKDANLIKYRLHTRRKTIAAVEPHNAFWDKRWKPVLKGNKPSKRFSFGDLPSIPEKKNPFLSQQNTRRKTIAAVEPFINTHILKKNASSAEQDEAVTKHTIECRGSLAKATAIEPANDEVELFEIKQLPERPRFASSLSQEAQFAIMKGYEDLVYSNLCKQYPQHSRKLHRTETPHRPTVVRYSDPSIGDTYGGENAYYGKDSGIPVTSGSVAVNSDDQGDKATGNVTLSNASTKTTVVLQYGPKGNKTPTQKTQEKSKLKMTYMCESGMHILDDLREEQGLYRLSPKRAGITSLGEPYRVYNSWSHGWSKGFESGWHGHGHTCSQDSCSVIFLMCS